MPLYEYYSDETKEEKEVFHGIHEEPVIKDSKGNIMKRKIGNVNFLMGKENKDSTRRTTVQQRHGKKKTWSSRTPSEAAHSKAQESQKKQKEKQDPYANFR